MQRTTDAGQSPSPTDSLDGDSLSGISGLLEQPLSRYATTDPDEEPVSPQTLEDVYKLVRWLRQQSDTVSATVSDDGMLSIATIFPNDVWLYVEIERDGSTGAAVTRERRYARDISATTVADLTPEVIFDAVGSV